MASLRALRRRVAGVIIAAVDARAWPWVLVVALGLQGGIAQAQSDGEGGRTAAPAWREPSTLRANVDEAVRMLTAGRSTEARFFLEGVVRYGRYDPQSMEVLPVLLRLARAMMSERPPPASQPPPPPPEVPPAPPTDDEVLARLVDASIRLLAGGHVGDARATLAAAQGGRAADPHALDAVGVLRRVALETRVAGAGGAPAVPGVGREYPPPLEGALAAAAGEDTIDTMETVVLYGAGALYGFETGLWLMMQSRTTRASAAVGLVPILAGVGGAGVAAMLGNRRTLRRGRAYAANAGMILGFAAGFALGADARNVFGERFREPGLTSAAWIGTTLGLGAGVLLGNLTDAAPGSAGFVLTGGVWGGGLAILLAAGMNPSDRVEDPALTWIVGETVGAALAFATAHELGPTPGQARWADLGALGGLLLSTLVSSVASDGRRFDPLVAAGLTAAGGVAGFLLGAPGDRPVDRGAPAMQAWQVAPSLTPRGDGAMLTLSLPTLL